MSIRKIILSVMILSSIQMLSACDSRIKQTPQAPAQTTQSQQQPPQQKPTQEQENSKSQAEQKIIQPSTSNIEVGFSPEGTAEELILRVIDTSKQTIFVSAYSFTSPKVTRHLIEASKRGVAVWLVVDLKNNLIDNPKKGAVSALNALVSAGAKVRVNSNYSIHHDKVIISDRTTVQTGSFNYSSSANDMNSENAIVIWNNPNLAEQYYAHWYSRYQEGQDYVPKY